MLGLSETRRRLADHGKVFLEREADACDGAFVEEPANQGHAVRHSPRRLEIGQRPTWVGRPVAASLISTNPARRVRDGWPVKLPMVSVSSRSAAKKIGNALVYPTMQLRGLT
jgi:hypothetical protein